MQIIDLSHNIEEGMLTFCAPWHSIVSITQLGRLDVEGRRTSLISVGSHTGTHIDAPLHFIKNGKSIDQIPLKKLIGDVSIIDLSSLKENEVVSYEILKTFNFGKKVIFNFGWAKYWNTRKFYKNYPYFSKDAAQYLVDFGVELVGMDTASPDDSRIVLSGENLGSELDSPIHKLFLKNQIVILEYLANLDAIDDEKNWKLIAMPLKLKGCDGSPARICIYKEN